MAVAESGVLFALRQNFGARASLLMPMRDPAVRGVVSFDGGIATATAAERFRTAPSFDARKARAPILHFYEELDAFMTPHFALLQSLPSTLTLAAQLGMYHAHFISMGFGCGPTSAGSPAARCRSHDRP